MAKDPPEKHHVFPPITVDIQAEIRCPLLPPVFSPFARSLPLLPLELGITRWQCNTGFDQTVGIGFSFSSASRKKTVKGTRKRGRGDGGDLMPGAARSLRYRLCNVVFLCCREGESGLVRPRETEKSGFRPRHLCRLARR